MSIEAPGPSLIATGTTVGAAIGPSVDFSPSFSNFSPETSTPSIDLGGTFNADFNPSSFKNYEVLSTPLFDHPMDASEDIAAYTSIFSVESPASPVELPVIPDVFLDINIPQDFSTRFEPARFEAAAPPDGFIMPAAEFDLNSIANKIVEDAEEAQLEVDDELELQTFAVADNQEIVQAISRVAAEPVMDLQPARSLRNSLALDRKTMMRTRIELMPETEVSSESQEEKVTILEDQKDDTETVDQTEQSQTLKKAKLVDQDASEHRLEMVRQVLADQNEGQLISGEDLSFLEETDPMRSGVLKQSEDDTMAKQSDGSYLANIEDFRNIKARTKIEFIDLAREKIRKTPPVILKESGQDEVSNKDLDVVLNYRKAPMLIHRIITRMVEVVKHKMVERKVEEEVLEAA